MNKFKEKYGDLFLATFILLNGGNLMTWATVILINVISNGWAWPLLLLALLGAPGGFVSFMAGLMLVREEINELRKCKKKEVEEKQAQQSGNADGEI